MSIASKELKPTKENLLTTLKADAIDRNKYIARFVTLCNDANDGLSVAVDGGWGEGKTFFIKQALMIIDACNPNYHNELTEDEIRDVKKAATSIHGFLIDEIRPQVCCYYDAWDNDNDADPLLSLLYYISLSVCEGFTHTDNKPIKNKLATIADVFTGWNTKAVVDAFRSEDPFELIEKQKRLRLEIIDFLDSVLAERGDRLIVVIDELDRCNPIFALRLLERVKHYFDNERITFVFSTNLRELQHSIKTYYGEHFDACRYLDRFFDLTISIPPANMEKYLYSIGVQDNYYTFDKMCRMLAKRCGFTMRETERFFKTAYTCAYSVTHGKTMWDSTTAHGVSFANMVMVPVILAIKKNNYEDYYDFINGVNGDRLTDLIEESELTHRMCNNLLSYNESFDRTDENTVTVDFRERLNMAYEALFNNRRDEEILIGNCTFSNSLKTNILAITSMLTLDSTY